MSEILNRLRRVRVLLVAVPAGLIVGGVSSAAVMAAIPNNKGVIQSCYDTTSGALRVIDPPAGTCSGTESSLKWDQDGVKAYAHLISTHSEEQGQSVFSLDTGRSKNVNSVTTTSYNEIPNFQYISCWDLKIAPKNVSVMNQSTDQVGATVDPAEYAAIDPSGICPTGTDAISISDGQAGIYVQFF